MFLSRVGVRSIVQEAGPLSRGQVQGLRGRSMVDGFRSSLGCEGSGPRCRVWGDELSS